jgi:hypothetical protein
MTMSTGQGVLEAGEAVALVKAGKAVVFDYSILRTTAECPTKAFVLHGMHRRPRGLTLALTNGTAVHAAVAWWLQHGLTLKAAEKGLQIFTDIYAPAWKAAKAQDEQLADNDRLSFQRCLDILAQWLVQRSGEAGGSFPFVAMAHKVERSLVARLGMSLKDGREVLYSARLDAQVRKGDSGVKWSMDHKTCKGAVEWWVGKQKVSAQFSGQKWVCEQAGDPVAGVIVNAIEFPTPHKSERKCPIHKVAYLECSVKHAGGTYVYVTRNPAEMDAWLVTVKKRVREMERLGRIADDEGWGGLTQVEMRGRFNECCTFCECKQWCDNGRPTGEANVKAEFEEYWWDPIADQDQEG